MAPERSVPSVRSPSAPTVCGLVSYFDHTNEHLKVAHCSDAACSSATTSTVDAERGVGALTSITLGADGLGIVSYLDYANGDLKVLHCSNAECSTGTTTRVDTGGIVGDSSSITVGADRLALISYRDATNNALKTAHCLKIDCSMATTATVDRGLGAISDPTSLRIGADGLALISYLDGSRRHLKAAHCLDLSCSAATTGTLDSSAKVGFYPSVMIGTDGLALISYFDEENEHLKVAHCSTAPCTPLRLTAQKA